MSGQITILLTGSIVPAVNIVAVDDVALRRRQYLAALHYYRAFAPVYFLENSAYDIGSDPEFSGLEGVQIRKFSMLPDSSRGKGYQEFAMIDNWLDTAGAGSPLLLKITGRYIVLNVKNLLQECQRTAPQTILIDRLPRSKTALTSIFFTSQHRYATTLKGLYRKMDDAAGVWAEHVIYRALAGLPSVRTFAHEPDLRGMSGSTGGALENPRWKWHAKQVLRRVNRIFDSNLLYFRGQ